MFFFSSFPNPFFIWLSGFFILFCYLLFVLICQVLVTFYTWFCWLLVLLQSIFIFLASNYIQGRRSRGATGAQAPLF